MISSVPNTWRMRKLRPVPPAGGREHGERCCSRCYNNEAATAEGSNIDYRASVEPAEKASMLAFTLMPFDVNHLSHREPPRQPANPDDTGPHKDLCVLPNDREEQRTKNSWRQRHEWGSNPCSLVYETNAVQLGHHAYISAYIWLNQVLLFNLLRPGFHICGQHIFGHLHRK